MIGGVLALLAIVIVAIVALQGGEGSPETAAGSNNQAEHTIEGSFTDTGESCFGSEGDDDIGPGAQVTVHNEAGATLATTSLGEGEYLDGLGCAYPFTVGVPNADFYRIEVSHRGVFEFGRSEMENNDWKVYLVPGS